jgi:uncharacterized repeat protein (TIGR03803 family)
VRTLTLTRSALSISVAVAFLAGCGSQTAFNPTTGFKGTGNAPYARSLTRNYSVLFSFDNTDGASPYAGLLNVNGTLYGTTYTGGGGTNCPDSEGCGTVFSITRSGKETVLYKFLGPPDGAAPGGSLIDVNGTLYGTTGWGGTCKTHSLGCGTVFSVTTAGEEKVLYRFAGHDGGPTGALIDVNGTLYGTTSGTVFSITTAGKEKVVCRFDGKYGIEPSPLTYLNGTFYGTMYFGGTKNYGTVFSVTKAGGERVLYNFAGPPDGALPTGGLLNVDGTLYGTTSSGGDTGCNSSSLNCGTVYSITTTGKEQVLYRFAGSPYDGGDPNEQLLSEGDMLYGTTAGGGALGGGTVFSISTAGKESILHSFGAHHDGYAPLAGLIDVKNMLYGTTSSGSDYRVGTVFALKP